jgi:hypothetical protein
MNIAGYDILFLSNKNKKKRTFSIDVLILVSSACFEHPSFQIQEDLCMQFYGISFMHPYK